MATGDVKHDEFVLSWWSRLRFVGSRRAGGIPAAGAADPSRECHVSWPVPTLPTLYLGYHMPRVGPGKSRHRRFGSDRAGQYSARPGPLPGAGAQGTEGRDPGMGRTFRTAIRGCSGCLVGDWPPPTCRRCGHTSNRRCPGQGLAVAHGFTLDAVRWLVVSKYAYAAHSLQRDAVAHAVGEWIAITGRPDAMNDLFAAFERLAPADLQHTWPPGI